MVDYLRMAIATLDGSSPTIRVFRGQGMNQSDFKKLEVNQGGLLTFNNFLSTSSDEDMATYFAHQVCNAGDPNIVPLLMHVEIGLEAYITKPVLQALPQLFQNPELNKCTTDEEKLAFILIHLASIFDVEKMIESNKDPASNNRNCPFAEISDLSAFPTESEVLFSASTVFRIHKLQEGPDGIRHVFLTMNNDADEKLRSSLNYYRKKTASKHTLHRFAKLLFEMGQLDESERFYRRLLNDSPLSTSDVARDNLTRTQCHLELGNILRIRKQYSEVLEHARKAITIISEIRPPNQILLASAQLFTANLSRDIGNFDEAKSMIFNTIDGLLSIQKNGGGQESVEMIMAGLSDLLQICIQHPDDDSLFERIQTIWSQLPHQFSTDSLSVATIHHQFSIYLEQRNRIQEALEQAEKAVAVVQNVLPYDHPNVNEYKQHIHTIRRKL